MSFKKLEGLTKDGNPRTLFRATAINADQFKLLNEIIAHFNGETKLTRKQCRDAHGVLRGKKAAPYFISKNVACKVKGAHGVYNLGVLKLAKGAITEVAAVVEIPVVAAPKPKKESRPKREAKAKRESKPVENTQPKLHEAPTVDQTIAQMEAVGITSAE